jgi:predicted RNA-binding Zn-ribbon protein involved in translation (DUF1610 family)
VDCPSCKASIDDDAYYCDQCGSELMRCTKCQRLGASKRCPADGAPLASIRTTAGTQVLQSPAVPATPAKVTASGGQVLRLFSAAQGLDLRPISDDILGRRFGPHVDTLARFVQISSNHLSVRRDEQGRWLAKDLNSTNGSFYNGVRLLPMQEQELAAGALLALGDIALSVSFE